MAATNVAAMDATVHELELTADEDFILTAWMYRMMQRDIAGSKSKRATSKRAARDEFRTAAADAFAARRTTDFSPEIADTVKRFSGEALRPDPEVLEDAGPEVSHLVVRRSRALLLLIDLYGFEPWTEAKWEGDARKKTLAEAQSALTELHPEDLQAVETAYKDAIKKLSKTGAWTKYALLAGAGLGIGILTGGLAGPAIAAAYGSYVLGMSGAAAASAGMAAIGGGSLAAGGLGMAGGAAIIAGVGGAAGAGAAMAGGELSGFTTARVAADAIKLHVVTQLVIRDVDGNEEAAKAVIVSLRERVAGFGKTIEELANKVEQLRGQLAAKQAEVDAAREQALADQDRFARLKAAAERLVEEVTRTGEPGTEAACSPKSRRLKARRGPSKTWQKRSPSLPTTWRPRERHRR